MLIFSCLPNIAVKRYLDTKMGRKFWAPSQKKFQHDLRDFGKFFLNHIPPLNFLEKVQRGILSPSPSLRPFLILSKITSDIIGQAKPQPLNPITS